MTHKLLDLRFGPGSSTGFTPAGIAGFGDLKPSAVVRELIQNSLDAAVEAGEKTAIVRFRITRRKTRDIPGIQSYREAFYAAVKSQETNNGGTLANQAQRVVDNIEKTLEQDEHDTLSILDNGIGLNKTKMAALLSDGVSAKGEGATGTFGNGHSVAIPASDLRYVLYGGITEDGDRIGAGHAVLASQKVPGEPHQKAANGFLIHAFQDGSHEYVEGSAIPDPIASELENIRESSIRGTAVIIPGFNNFRQDKPLWDMVAKAAACNFFQAIQEDKLAVWVEDMRPGKRQDNSLDRSTLKEVLETNRNKKRSRAFLSGQKAFEAHEVLQSGKRHTVQTSQGKIRVQLRVGVPGGTRVDLCRNGMWITKDIPGFYSAFTDRTPFHALLLLDPTAGGLYELVRNAEGPLHNTLDVKQRLSSSDARALRAAFKEIREWLRSNVSKISGDSYSPDDFLTLDFGEDANAGGGRAQHSFWGTPTAVDRRNPDVSWRSPLRGDVGPLPEPGKKTRHTNVTRSRNRPVLRPFFQAASVPCGPNRRYILIECQESCENAELHLCVDENMDATCDHLRRDEIATVFLSNVKVEDRRARDNDLIRENGRIVGVRLGNLAANASVRVNMEYQLPENLSVPPGQEPTLRVEVFKAPSATAPEV